MKLPLSANGTPESIHFWAKEAFDGDIDKERAFEILASKFVLTYITDIDNDNDADHNTIGMTATEYQHCKTILQQIVGKPADNQLIMFMIGSHACGKRELINQLLIYGKRFCNSINKPFTKYTILVTASSWKAATFIRGQSLLSATRLRGNVRNIDPERKKNFQNNVRLLVIDGISLLSTSDIEKLSFRLNWLMDTKKGAYGGLDIAFMGDFGQLRPIPNQTVYDGKTATFRCYVNCFIEFKDLCKCKNDSNHTFDLCKYNNNDDDHVPESLQKMLGCFRTFCSPSPFDYGILKHDNALQL